VKKIKAVNMVRGIRDKQAKDTAGKSASAVVAYFRKKAGKFSVTTVDKVLRTDEDSDDCLRVETESRALHSV
jgi:hypothetical protein